MFEQASSTVGKRRSCPTSSSLERDDGEGRGLSTIEDSNRQRRKPAKLSTDMTAVSFFNSCLSRRWLCPSMRPKIEDDGFWRTVPRILRAESQPWSGILNHGSFGATPKVVLGKLRMLNSQLEEHPDQWFPEQLFLWSAFSSRVGKVCILR